MADLDREKQLAALRSLDYVRDGMLLGLGSGSTAAHAIRLLGERVHGGLQITGIPTSSPTAELAQQVGIPLVTFDTSTRIDLTIDGADEVGPELSRIKGGGGALLREKIVAFASREVLIIADSSKLVSTLGKFPLPVEVIPFACPVVQEQIAALGGRPVLRVRTPPNPFLTDEGNYILDCHFETIADPERLAAQLNAIPGVVEHGLFLQMATRVLVGRGDEVEVLEAERKG